MSHFFFPCRNGTWKITCKEWSLNVIKRNKSNCFTEEHLLTGRDGIIETGYSFTCSDTNDSTNVINITWYKVLLKLFLVYRSSQEEGDNIPQWKLSSTAFIHCNNKNTKDHLSCREHCLPLCLVILVASMKTQYEYSIMVFNRVHHL